MAHVINCLMYFEKKYLTINDVLHSWLIKYYCLLGSRKSLKHKFSFRQYIGYGGRRL